MAQERVQPVYSMVANVYVNLVFRAGGVIYVKQDTITSQTMDVQVRFTNITKCNVGLLY